MRELFARLFSRPGLMLEMVAATLFANVLALASPLFVIQVLNRYVAQGVDATLATLTAGAEKVQAAYTPANVSALLDVPFALLFIGVLYLLNPTLALVVVIFVTLGFLISVITLASLRGPSREMAAASGRRGGLIASAIQAGDTVRAFNAGGFMARLWNDETGAFQGLVRRIAQRQGFVQTLGMTIQAMMSTCVIAVGAFQAVKGQMDVGAMIGANILAARALGPIIKLATLSEAVAKSRQALNMFKEFAKLPVEKAEGTALGRFTKSIEFQDMAFAHPGAKTPLFESVNLKLEPASVLVFSGANGSGKTTLARLVAGLIEPTRGRILADGVDLQQVAPEWWRGQISCLSQEPKLLNGTLRDNVIMANPEIGQATLNDVIDRAGLRKFIDQSPEGLDAPVVHNGANPSLGIRRRLALARALSTDGMLMIVDEPTEGVDAEGAGRVIEAMNEAAKRGRTVLAFSHDPQILQGAPHYVDLNSKPVPTLVRKPAEGGAREPAPAAANEPIRSAGS